MVLQIQLRLVPKMTFEHNNAPRMAETGRCTVHGGLLGATTILATLGNSLRRGRSSHVVDNTVIVSKVLTTDCILLQQSSLDRGKRLSTPKLPSSFAASDERKIILA